MRLQRERFEKRLHEMEPWDLACKYMGWFAVECHWTTAEVFSTPWPQLIQLTLLADDMADQRRSQQTQAELANRPAQRMM